MRNKLLNSFTYSVILLTSTACHHPDAISNYSRQVQCDEQQATIVFNDKKAELVIDETTYQLNRTVAASGEKYQNATALVWLKGNEALIEVNNIRLTHCQLIQHK